MIIAFQLSWKCFVSWSLNFGVNCDKSLEIHVSFLKRWWTLKNYIWVNYYCRMGKLKIPKENYPHELSVITPYISFGKSLFTVNLPITDFKYIHSLDFQVPQRVSTFEELYLKHNGNNFLVFKIYLNCVYYKFSRFINFVVCPRVCGRFSVSWKNPFASTMVHLLYNNLPSTYGVPSIAGTVKPTPTRNSTQVVKFGAKAVATPNTNCMKRYMKNAGFLPRPSCKYPKI